MSKITNDGSGRQRVNNDVIIDMKFIWVLNRRTFN